MLRSHIKQCSTMSTPDQQQRFLFESSPVRGELVSLDKTWLNMIEARDYPPVVERLLGQFAAAAALLASTLKFEGRLILQAQGEGPISLFVMECTSAHTLRGLAKWETLPETEALAALLGDGRLVITIEPDYGGERYQGIVDLKGESVAAVLEHYLAHSEQLPTRLWLAANGERACGLLLQRLPAADNEDQDAAEDAWRRAQILGDTLSETELLGLPTNEIRHRLFHEENLRVFKPETLRFACGCSRERVARALRVVGHAELLTMLESQEAIEIHCEFCNKHYAFDRVDVEQVFASTVQDSAEPTRH